MAESAYTFVGTTDNFQQLVLENSARGPVLVNYWSPQARPCMLLMPVLDRLVAAYQGRFLLVRRYRVKLLECLDAGRETT